jgi:hypothetical protein
MFQFNLYEQDFISLIAACDKLDNVVCTTTYVQKHVNSSGLNCSETKAVLTKNPGRMNTKNGDNYMFNFLGPLN